MPSSCDFTKSSVVPTNRNTVTVSLQLDNPQQGFKRAKHFDIFFKNDKLLRIEKDRAINFTWALFYRTFSYWRWIQYLRASMSSSAIGCYGITKTKCNLKENILFRSEEEYFHVPKSAKILSHFENQNYLTALAATFSSYSVYPQTRRQKNFINLLKALIILWRRYLTLVMMTFPSTFHTQF